MPTIEELLIRMSVDPQSVDDLIKGIEDVKSKVDTDLELQVDTNVGEAAAEVNGALGEMKGKVEDVGAALKNAFDEGNAALNKLRGTVLAISAAGTLGFGVALASAREESNNLARANVILKLSSEDLALAQGELRKVAVETGLSFSEVSKALFDVASAGFQGKTAIDITAEAARVAVPAGVSVADAFNAIATAVNNFGFTAQEAADKLVVIGDQTRGTITDVVDAIGRVGGVASSFNIAFDEIGSAFSLLSRSTGNAAESTTILRAVIASFISPANEAVDTFKKLGIEVGQNAFQSQTLAEKIAILAKAAQDGSADFGQLFNREALIGAAILTDRVDELNLGVEQLANATGRTQEAFDDFIQSVGPQLDQLGTNILNALTAVGSVILEVLQPIVAFIADFAQNNQTLVGSLLALGIGVGILTAALTALGFVITQINAILTVYNSALKINTLSQVADTEATLGNTAAQEANVTARSGMLGIVGRAIKFLGSVKALLLTETGTLVANTQAWIANLLSRSRLDAVSGTLAGTIFRISNTIKDFTSTLLNAASAAYRTGGALAAFRTILNGLAGPLGAAVSAISVLGVAAVVAAAAFIGWKIGSFINEFLGFGEAVDGAARSLADPNKGFVRSLDDVKGLIITALVNPLALAQNAMTRYERSVQEANKVKFLETIPGAIERYNELLEQGFNTTQAFSAALNEANELEILRAKRLDAQRSGRDLDEKQLARLNVLEATIGQTLRDQTVELDANRAAHISRGDAFKILEETEKDFVKLVKDTGKEVLEARLGTESSTIVELRQKAEERLTLLAQRANAEKVIEEDLIAEIEDLHSKDQTSAIVQEQLRNREDALEKSRQKIAQIEELSAQQIEIFSERVADAYAQRADKLQQEAEKEIQAEERRVNSLITANERLVEKTREQINKIIQARQEGEDKAINLVKQLNLEEVRRNDSLKANLITRGEEIKQGILGAKTEETRNELITKGVESLRAIANDNTKELQARERLTSIEEQLNDLASRKVSSEGDLNNSLRQGKSLLAEKATLEASIAKEIELRAQRQEELANFEEQFAIAAEDSANLRSVEEEEINTLQLQQVDAQNENLDLEIERARVEQIITDRMNDQLKALDSFKNTQLNVLDLALKIAEAQAGGASRERIDELRASLEEAKQVADSIGNAVKNQAQLSAEDIRKAAQSGPVSGAEFDKFQREALLGDTGLTPQEFQDIANRIELLGVQQQEIKQATEDIQPAIESLQDANTQAQESLAPVSDQLASAVDAQASLGDSINEFGTEVVTKMEEFELAMTSTRDNIQGALDRIRKIEVSTTLEERDLETAGVT